MTRNKDRCWSIIGPDEWRSSYGRHVQGGLVRSGASIFMWCFCWLAYGFGIIEIENFTGVSLCVLYLILLGPLSLWILRRITNKRGFAYFSLFINLLEVIGYTAIMHFLGGVEALYLLPVYAAIILYVGFVASRKRPFIIAAFCIVCFSAMLTLEHFGILRTYTLNPTFISPWPNQMMIMTVNATLLLLFAFVSSHMARLLKKNRDQLQRQNEELRAALDRASESDRLKSEFLANMSHELRTPLNAIIGFSELLGYPKTGNLNEGQKAFVRNINASGNHLLSLISDILDLSRIEAGRMRMALEEVPLPALLEDSLVMFRKETAKAGVQLLLDIAKCPETLWVDELRIKQIIYNLLSNAVKFTPGGGKVVLSARLLPWTDSGWPTGDGNPVFPPNIEDPERMRRNGVVDVAVSDTGIGIRQEDRERIFRPFEQGDGSMTRQYEGTGLGLSLTRRLVELHGGYMYVESEGENRGSVFHCLFPV